MSEWLLVNGGTPQGSVLCLLLFAIFINDLLFDILSPVKLFADDTSQLAIVHRAKISVCELKLESCKLNTNKYKITSI